jgi:hypothetical protein
MRQDAKASIKQDWQKQAAEIKNSVKPAEYQTIAPEKKYEFEWNDGDQDTSRSLDEPNRLRSQFPRLKRKGGGNPLSL